MSNTSPPRADPVVVFPLSWWCPPQETSQPHPPHMLLQALRIISKPSVYWNLSYSLETLKYGQNLWFFVHVTLKFDGWPWKTIGHPVYVASSLPYASFQSHQWTLTGVTVRKLPIWLKIDVLSCVTLKFYRWPWKTIRHLYYATSSFVHNFVATGEFKLELQSGSKSIIFFEPCDLEILRMTLKNNRAPLRSNIKLCASFHHHMWIQTGVMVRKLLTWVLTSVTLTFHFWPEPLHGPHFVRW